MYPQSVRYENDPVKCPECKQEVRKGKGVHAASLPTSDSATPNPATTNIWGIWGKAYCENQECPVSSDFIDWSFEFRGSSPKSVN